MKERINVVSCFDGMSCGQIALNQLGIPIGKYYASEIDKHAIKVCLDNHPNTVQLGDVCQVEENYFSRRIDLLLGGSPCQGFSYAGLGLNFNDPRSKLFFEFVRLKNELQPKYFLLENVRMEQKHQDVISEYLGVQPILINSRLVSCQDRKRLYWTNIPNVSQPEDLGQYIKDVFPEDTVPPTFEEASKEIAKYTSREFGVSISKGGRVRPHRTAKKSGISEVGTITPPNDKCVCLTTSHYPKTYKTPFEIVPFTRNMLEYAQNVPTDYTKAVSLNQAKRMLGNGWTVNVIAHILKNMV